MRKKLLPFIVMCGSCPFWTLLGHSYETSESVCKAMNKKPIEEKDFGIPEWCPLPDASDEMKWPEDNLR